MDLHAERLATDPRDGSEVAQEVVVEIAVECGVDGVSHGSQQQRVPIGRRMHDGSVAILLPAPGRFSTMNCWPNRSDSHCPIRRARMSGAPPAPKPTMMRTGRDG